MQTIIISLFVVIVLGLVAWTIVRSIKADRIRKHFLAKRRFVGCDGEKKNLAERITWLEHNSGHAYSVSQPMKTTLAGKTVYFYTKNRRRTGNDLFTAHEFLFPLERQSEEPFLFYLKPSALDDGMVMELLRKMTTSKFDAQPDDLVEMKSSSPLEKNKLISALGPEGKKPSDLLESDLLKRVLEGGDHDVVIIRSRGGFCSIDHPAQGADWDLDRAWKYIETLVTR